MCCRVTESRYRPLVFQCTCHFKVLQKTEGKWSYGLSHRFILKTWVLKIQGGTCVYIIATPCRSYTRLGSHMTNSTSSIKQSPMTIHIPNYPSYNIMQTKNLQQTHKMELDYSVRRRQYFYFQTTTYRDNMRGYRSSGLVPIPSIHML